MRENRTRMETLNLTTEQERAVRHTGSSLLVSASAGSGKTKVLIERIIYILEHEKNVSLKNMAIMTFTRAAAQEMKERLRSRVLNKLAEGEDVQKWQTVLYEIPTAYITTIDSFCNSIVREHFYKLGLDMNYSVMDPIEERLMELEVWDGLYREGFETSMELEQGWSFEKLTDYFDSGFSMEGLKNAVLSFSHFCDSEPWPEEYLDAAEAFYSGRDTEEWMRGFEVGGEKSRWIEEFARFYKLTREEALEKLSSSAEFEILSGAVRSLVRVVQLFRERMAKRKKAKGKASFADLEHFALRILAERKDKVSRQSSVGLSYAKTFAHIMVDEYQDSNYLQEEIVNSISNGHNVFMVGDLKQSIYGFRQAKCEIFENKLKRFSQSIQGEVLFLSRNFRSDSRILEFVNRICGYAMDGETYSMKYEKEHLLQAGLKGEKDTGDRAVNVLMVKENYSYQKSEAMSAHDAAALEIGRRIQKLISEGTSVCASGREKAVSYGDIAVLMRAKEGKASSYIRAFEELEIPYELISSDSFLDGPEVRALLDYMRLIDNSLQDIPMASVMLSFIGRFTEEELVRIRLFSDAKLSFYQAVKSYAEAFEMQEDVGEEKRDFFDRELSERVAGFLRQIGVLKSYRYLLPFSDWIGKLLKETKAVLYVSRSEYAPKKLEEIRQLETLALSFGEGEYDGLEDFLYYIDKMNETGYSPNRRNRAEATSDAVRIMTIHGSKGLEFPVVFYTGLSGRFHIKSESPALHSTAGPGLPVIDLKERVKKYSLIRNYINDLNKKQQMEEEIRLMYVALTRAESKLYLVLEGDLDTMLKKALYRSYPQYFKKAPVGTIGTMADVILPELCKRYPRVFLYALWLSDSTKDKPELIESAGAVLQEGSLSKEELRTCFDKENGIYLELCPFVGEGEALVECEPPEEREAESETDVKDLGEEILENLRLPYQNRRDVDKPGKISVTKYKEKRTEEFQDTVWSEEELGELGISVLKRETDGGLHIGNDRAILGTLYHKVLELWDFQAGFANLKEVEAYVQTLANRELIGKAAVRILDLKHILKFVQSDLYRRMKAADAEHRLFRERNFLYRIPASRIYPDGGDQPVMIEGIMDAYFIEDEALVLVDYKSDQSENPEYYRKNYRVPMELYAKSLAEAYQTERIEKIIYSLKIGAVVL